MFGYEPIAVATFLALVFVVLFLCIVVYLKVPRKLASFLDQRALLISRELDDARRLRLEAMALLEDYKIRTKNAESEAQAILDQAKQDATRLHDEAQAALKDMVERRTKAATAKISLAETQAVADVRLAATNVAIAAAQDVLASRMSGGLGAQLIDASIKDVKARLN